MKIRIILSALLTLSLLSAQAKDYDSLLGKADARAEGPVSLHKVGQKIYAEIPDSLLGKSFIFGSVVERCSDPLESHSGYVPKDPVEIVFSVADSTVYASIPSHFERGSDRFSSHAVSIANIPATVKSFSIECRHNGANIIDISSFIKAKSDFNNPLSPDAFNASEGYVKRTGEYVSASTAVLGVSADSLGAAVSCSYTFKVKSAFLGVFSADERKYLTAEISCYLKLLPENPLPEIRADRRAGYAAVGRRSYNADPAGASGELITLRRRLDDGVVFTVDSNFPETWAAAAFDAVENWNYAFEQAGLGRPLSARTGDSGQNMIHYIISPVQKVFDRKVCDPRSGEILASDIYVHHGVQEKIQIMLMFQTAGANERARKIKVDDAQLRDGLCFMLMRRIGRCLGLRDNLIASFAYSSEDIASADFSSRKGLSASIMDRLPFNYLTDSPDALFIQTKPGPADVFALECLYKYDYAQVQEALRANSGNPETAFMALQKPKAFYDPRAEYGDLGNDVLYSVRKGLEHLKFSMQNVNGWVREEDPDFTFRSYLRTYLLDQLLDYIRHGFEFIGGMYVHEADAFSSTPAKVPVPREEQRRCLKEMLGIIDSLTWADDNYSQLELEGPYSDFIRKYFTNYVFIQLGSMSRCRNFGDEAYKQEEAARDIMEHFWKKDADEFTRYQREMFIDQVSAYAANSDDPQMWFGILKDTRKSVRKSGDRYLLDLIDRKIAGI